MKVFIIVLSLFVITNIAQASYYVVNIENEVVAKMDYVPSEEDLSSRNEISVFSEEDIDLINAEYRNGKIVEHVETQAEKDAKKEKKDKGDEEDRIYRKMKHTACIQLEVEGIVFKKINCNDFDY